MSSEQLWPYFLYLLYLAWLVQSARLLAMLATGNWDAGVPGRKLVAALLDRRSRRKIK